MPLTRSGVSSGSKLFGAAILSKTDLSLLTVATNNERASPLLHGEINCIQKFFSSPYVPAYTSPHDNSTIEMKPRPSPSDCIFIATHEPCSLCLSGITWSGFDNFFYLFTYEDSRDLFNIPYDIDILQEVFRVPVQGETMQMHEKRELYNRQNKFFTAKSFSQLVDELDDEEERKKWRGEIQRVKELYDGLSKTYQEGKTGGVDSASFWK